MTTDQQRAAANLLASLEAWATAWASIQQQSQNAWLLKDGITVAGAEQAIDHAWQLADDLHSLADALEGQAGMADEMLP